MVRYLPVFAFIGLAALMACAIAPALGADSDHVPGVVVDHVPASTRQYIGSPSIVILPSGEYVASHDLFGPGSTLQRTLVFASADRGKTWSRRAVIDGQWWSTLFLHRGALYLIGTSKEYGFVVIRRSTDGGKRWSAPTDAASGLLLADARYHCAPVPVIVHNGRVWRAMEDAEGGGGWGKHFRAFMLSAPVDADLLRAEGWIASNRIARDASWLGGRFGGWLEGNAVVSPQGEVEDILRVELPEGPEQAAVLRISADGRRATFDPETGFRPFPGGAKKFTIRWDPASRLYWSLTNNVPETKPGIKPASLRNTLALCSSPDLRQWTVHSTLLSHPDSATHGFQYADWQFDGDDLVVLSRTAYDDGAGGAHNYHDANYLTFHRISRFREMGK